MPKEIVFRGRTAVRKGDPQRVCCRRRFLLAGSVLAATAAALPGVRLASRALARTVALSELGLAAFTGLLGTSFRVRPEAGRAVELKLLKAEPVPATRPARAGGAQWEGFWLVFCGPSAQPLSQAIYSFEHEQVGRFEMFIVPIGQPFDGQSRYQAVFNRPA